MAKGHGGYRPGSGRKTKAAEQKLFESLDAYIKPDDVFSVLREKIMKEKCAQSIKMYMNYRYGMPKQTVESDVSLSTFSLKEAIEFDD